MESGILAQGSGIEVLHRVARRLKASAERRLGAAVARLPALILMTDPARTPDPVASAQRLPPGSAVIYRAFGAPDAARIGRALAAVARRRGLILLVGADASLARAIGADGVHLPERLGHRARALRAAWPHALITVAAHSRQAVRRAERFGADAAVLSSIFASDSPSAGAPLGRVRFGAIARASGLPVYALGGVTMKNAPELLGSGAAGVAAVSALG
jgi:thiamine-phosphate pyrophosphorylase